MLDWFKGSGKSTLINHFLFSIFDKVKYNEKLFKLSDSSHYYINNLKDNIFQNIVKYNIFTGFRF